MRRQDIRYVTQDGGDFYIYLDADLTRLLRVVHAPMRVADMDLPAAQKAREWFVNLVADSGFVTEWPNPFGGDA